MTTHDFDPGPLAHVETHTGPGNGPGQVDDQGRVLVFTRDLDHAPDRVWSMLTDPERLRAWAPYTADRDLGAVGEANLTMVDSDDPEHLPASVGAAERPRLLEHTWGNERLRWELAPSEAGTRLVLRHTLEEPEYAAQMAAGWHLCLLVAERHLAGHPVPPIRGAEAREFGWEELRQAYAARLETPIGA